MNGLTKTIFKIDGLSVTGKAVHSIGKAAKKVLWAARQILALVLAALVLFSCHEKSGSQMVAEPKEKPVAKADSIRKPRVDIKVNRRYDEKGNVIAFDSTYSTYYSNVRGDTLKMDSLFKGFDRYFNNGHSSIFNNQFNDLFFRDSLWYPDFFHRDFFMKRYELNDSYMRDMMQRMDSVKNRFYREHQKTLEDPKGS
jgi:hypothetical protein